MKEQSSSGLSHCHFAGLGIGQRQFSPENEINDVSREDRWVIRAMAKLAARRKVEDQGVQIRC